MKTAIIGLVGGLALTGMTMLVPYQCCLNGDARGFPLAAFCPPCERTFSNGDVAEGEGPGHVVDFVKLLGNLSLWAGVSVGAHHWLSSRGMV